MMLHSPTPWHLSPISNSIRDGAGVRIIDAHPGRFGEDETSHADMAFAVAACNAYEPLLDLLSRIARAGVPDPRLREEVEATLVAAGAGKLDDGFMRSISEDLELIHLSASRLRRLSATRP
ncbi:hypothetical protein [Lutibaculum baratangense]|uniref:Uncharacterized protein n=1 Tax=Lutibaculum baratangense AMV1 TaxID=631454 RepID=V4RA40_9HYPH|nr:hypothetical protein [Lutibaculum baratangense]ESR23031.1 hypothetical protein N177_3099 [Lutibaculum baratangense AMV1]